MLVTPEVKSLWWKHKKLNVSSLGRAAGPAPLVENVLLRQRTWAPFLSNIYIGLLTSILAPVPGNSVSSSSLQGLLHTCDTHKFTQASTQIKINWFLKRKWWKEEGKPAEAGDTNSEMTERSCTLFMVLHKSLHLRWCHPMKKENHSTQVIIIKWNSLASLLQSHRV